METTRQICQVIWGYTTSELCEKLNKELKYGWKLSGGVCSSVQKGMGEQKRILLQTIYQDIPKTNNEKVAN